MTTTKEIKISLPLNQAITLIPGNKIKFIIEQIKNLVDTLEFEDVLFNLNSAVLMPAGPDGSKASQNSSQPPADNADTNEKQEHKSGLSAIQEILRYKNLNDKNKAKKIAIFGHTDTSGEPDYNRKLSAFRAESVSLLLQGGTEACEKWQKLYQSDRNNGVNVWIDDDLKTIFNWACEAHDFDQEITDKGSNKLGWKIQRFKMNWNQIFDPPSSDRMDPNKDTVKKKFWKAVYVMYQYTIAEISRPSKNDPLPSRPKFAKESSKYNTELTTSLRSTLTWLKDSPEQSQFGCGESCPIEEEQQSDYESEVNRRVEVMFFDGSEKPLVELTCHANGCVFKGGDGEICPVSKFIRNILKDRINYTWKNYTITAFTSKSYTDEKFILLDNNDQEVQPKIIPQNNCSKYVFENLADGFEYVLIQKVGDLEFIIDEDITVTKIAEMGKYTQYWPDLEEPENPFD